MRFLFSFLLIIGFVGAWNDSVAAQTKRWTRFGMDEARTQIYFDAATVDLTSANPNLRTIVVFTDD